VEEKYKSKHRVPSSRLQGWDYGSHGLYYITICTKDRVSYFGEIAPGEEGAYLTMSAIGEVENANWLKIPEYHHYVVLDEFIIMPNHLHGILFINNPDKTTWAVNKYGPQSKNLASIIRGFKSSVKAYSTTNNLEFAWQKRFFDRVIRTEKEYQNVRTYIYNNPDQWLLNGDNFDNLYIP
jgi:putative transposase